MFLLKFYDILLMSSQRTSEVKNMNQKSITITREKLNNAIADGLDYETVYSISVELDELIAQYYSEEE